MLPIDDPNPEWLQKVAVAEVLPSVLEDRAGVYEMLRVAHEKDKASYRFSCRLTGMFLVIEMTRGDKFLKQAINLVQQTTSFLLIPGGEPDLEGFVAFAVTEVAPKVWRAYPDWGDVYIPGHELIVERADIDKSPGMKNPRASGLIYVQHSPRRAVDDIIRLSGTNIDIHAPASMGEMVYDKILQALSTVSVFTVVEEGESDLNREGSGVTVTTPIRDSNQGG